MNTKRSYNKILCLLIVVLSFILTLTACGKVEFKVNFVVDGTVYATVDTNGDEVIKMPTNPTKDGYTFDGWYWDKDTWKQPFTANSLLDAPLSSDMSVYAKFVSDEVPPTEAFIIAGLKNIPNIVEVEAATEYNDPNGQLNKTGGYIADIFFSVDVINQRLISGTTLVEKGTDAGGSIEVYRTAKDAETRNSYLAAFDGGILASGSHKVIGTCVVRTSHELTASLQNILENNIEKMLTESTEAYVSMDSYLYTVAKEVAEKDNLSAYETATKLIELGYPLEKSEQIAKDCGVDFNNIAKKAVEGYANYYAMVSPLMVSELLADHEFTADNISYAVQNANIDWEFYATRHAEEYVLIAESSNEYLTPNAILVYLCWEKGYIYDWDEYVFDKSEYCQIALDNLNVNWNQKALEYIDYIEADGPLAQKSAYISELTGMDFTQSQAEYAVTNCNINWNTRALYCVEHYVEDLCTTPPNHSQCIAKLKDWGFSDSEANYAVSNYDGLIYPDKLDYVITLNPDGGTLSNTSLNVIFGKSFTLPTPIKDGYTFNGWYNGTIKVENGTWYTAENVTLKAKWTEKEYNINYVLDGGTNNTNNPKTYTLSETVTILAPSKTGYRFIGWKMSNESSTVYNPVISQGTKGDKTFIAVWEARTYNVTYLANGGNCSTTSATAIYDSYLTLPTATKTGYDFSGWYNGNKKYSSGTWKTANDTTLTAKWTAKTFTISYNANGGNVNSSSQSVAYDSNYTLLTPSRTGYKFLGWYSGSTKVENGKWTRLQNLSLKAEWEAKTYNVTFAANGGTCNTSSLTATFDSYLTMPTPTRTGYTFSGWYSGSSKYSSGTWKTDGNVSLTAKWTARTDIPYVVNHYQENIYDSGYTLYATQNLTGTADATIQPTTNSYTGFTSPSKQTVTVNPDGSRVVNYYYTRNSYSITFVTNGGNSISKITQKYQTSLNVPDAIREDYTFGGWFTNATLTSSYSKPTTMPATSRTLYAYWTEENKPGDFTYSSGSSSITVSAYKGSSTTMWIPAYISGKPVTTIPTSAFKNNSAITKVVVPNTVTSIGEGAFRGCSALADITLPFVGMSETTTYETQQVFGYIFGYTSYGGNVLTSNTSYDYTGQGLSYNSSYDYGFYIPSTIRNVTITKQVAIPAYAFYNCDLIESIIIPMNTTSVGDYAFYNCKNVAYYNANDDGVSVLPSTLTSISDYAFYENAAITRVIVSSDLTSIGSYAFYNCAALVEFIAEDTMSNFVNIDDYAFAGCSSLSKSFNGSETEIVIPNGVETIGSMAFYNNDAITKVIVPNTVMSIGEGAFRACSILEDISLPFVGKSETTTYETQQVFGYIFGYTPYGHNVATSNTSYDYTGQGLSYNSSYDYGFYIPSTIRNVTITKQVAIPAYAFYNCDLIETIVMPSNTTSVGDYAFYNCKKVTSFNANADGVSILPKSLTTISNYAFYENNALNQIVLSSDLESIGSYAFYNCTNLTQVIADSSITKLKTIGNYSFYGCSVLRKTFNGLDNEIIIPNGVETIGSYAFYNNDAITKVIIPATVMTISVGAFQYCSAIETITLPFVGRSEIVIYDEQQVFGYIFGYTNYGHNVVTSNTSYDYTGQGIAHSSSYDYGYYIPSTIKEVIITKQVAVPAYAFYNCDLIESIIIPTNTTSVGDYAFYNAKKLTSIDVPKSCFIGTDAFVNSGMINKTGIVYIGSVLYKYNGTMPSGYTVRVKDETTAIQANAFSGCSGLTTLILPEGLKSIGANAFKNCTSLKEVVVPPSVESIGSSAFYGCSALMKITIPFIGTSKTSMSAFSSIFSTVPSSLTTVVVTGNVDIPANAFKNCTKLTTITFTGTIGAIGANAFYGCSALTTLTLPNTVTSIGNYAFYGCSKLTAVDLGSMSGLTSLGSYAFQNCTSITSIAIPENITIIGDYTFSGCTKLASVSMSSKTTAIGNYAFNGCTSLTTFTLNSDILESIGAYAFQNCSSLATIYIPTAVETIGEYAFNGCSALTINCGASSQPDDWDYNWNPSNCTVKWGE